MAKRNKYKGITFAEGYDKTFEQFQKEFETTHVFARMPEKQRLVEMKKAFDIATTVHADDIDVDAETVKGDKALPAKAENAAKPAAGK